MLHNEFARLMTMLATDCGVQADVMKMVRLTIQVNGNSMTQPANANVLTQDEVNKRKAQHFMHNATEILATDAGVVVPTARQQFNASISGVTNATVKTSYELNAGHIVQENRPKAVVREFRPHPDSNIRLLSDYRKAPAA